MISFFWKFKYESPTSCPATNRTLSLLEVLLLKRESRRYVGTLWKLVLHSGITVPSWNSSKYRILSAFCSQQPLKWQCRFLGLVVLHGSVTTDRQRDRCHLSFTTEEIICLRSLLLRLTMWQWIIPKCYFAIFISNHYFI